MVRSIPKERRLVEQGRQDGFIDRSCGVAGLSSRTYLCVHGAVRDDGPGGTMKVAVFPRPSDSSGVGTPSDSRYPFGRCDDCIPGHKVMTASRQVRYATPMGPRLVPSQYGCIACLCIYMDI